nr:unnamed protein product [Callosobruchus chinensis]
MTPESCITTNVEQFQMTEGCFIYFNEIPSLSPLHKGEKCLVNVATSRRRGTLAERGERFMLDARGTRRERRSKLRSIVKGRGFAASWQTIADFCYAT